MYAYKSKFTSFLILCVNWILGQRKSTGEMIAHISINWLSKRLASSITNGKNIQTRHSNDLIIYVELSTRSLLFKLFWVSPNCVPWRDHDATNMHTRIHTHQSDWYDKFNYFLFMFDDMMTSNVTEREEILTTHVYKMTRTVARQNWNKKNQAMKWKKKTKNTNIQNKTCGHNSLMVNAFACH